MGYALPPCGFHRVEQTPDSRSERMIRRNIRMPPLSSVGVGGAAYF